MWNFQTEQMNINLGVVLTSLTFRHTIMSSVNGNAEQKCSDYLNSYSYTADLLLSLKGNKHTSNLDEKACLIIKELGIKGISGDQEEEKIDEEYRTRIVVSMKNGLDHYLNTTEYNGKARILDSS